MADRRYLPQCHVRHQATQTPAARVNKSPSRTPLRSEKYLQAVLQYLLNAVGESIRSAILLPNLPARRGTDNEVCEYRDSGDRNVYCSGLGGA